MIRFFCFFILLSKYFDSRYVDSFGTAHWAKKYKEFTKEELKFIARYQGQILVDQPIEEFKQKGQKDLGKLKNAHETHLKLRDRYYKSMRVCHRLAEISMIAGTILLLHFSVQLTQAIVWNS